jgi:hypothetical protein
VGATVGLFGGLEIVESATNGAAGLEGHFGIEWGEKKVWKLVIYPPVGPAYLHIAIRRYFVRNDGLHNKFIFYVVE